MVAMKNTNNNLSKLVLSALFTALCCVATIVIQIPIPLTEGYIHPGDAFVFLSGILLGPLYGGFAAGVGSMLADIFTGYMNYAPGTLLIKLSSAIIVGALFHLLHSKIEKSSNSILSVIISSILGAIIIVLGYFFYSFFFLGTGYAAVVTSILPNVIQTGFGVLIATILYPIISKLFHSNQR